jgi:hypothetical protein
MSGLDFVESCDLDFFVRQNSRTLTLTANPSGGSYTLYHRILWANDSVTEYRCQLTKD